MDDDVSAKLLIVVVIHPLLHPHHPRGAQPVLLPPVGIAHPRNLPVVHLLPQLLLLLIEERLVAHEGVVRLIDRMPTLLTLVPAQLQIPVCRRILRRVIFWQRWLFANPFLARVKRRGRGGIEAWGGGGAREIATDRGRRCAPNHHASFRVERAAAAVDGRVKRRRRHL